MNKYKKVVLDLETTGLSSKSDEILQVRMKKFMLFWEWWTDIVLYIIEIWRRKNVKIKNYICWW